jgi:glycosyltransferase involved in cell wall biosynthesis
MTAYNRADYISAAIESIISSSLEDWELIITDDQSTDNTLNIARKYEALDKRIKVYLNEKNLGDYPNRNQAASYAIGKYIKYVDADDMIYPYTLEALVGFMERFPDAGFGMSSEASLDEPFPICISPEEIYREHFDGFGHFERAPGSAIIKREAFNRVKGFSGKRMIGDYEFWIKISRYYSMVKYPHGIYWNRHHDHQESKTDYAKRNYAKLMADVMNEALEHKDLPIPKQEMEWLIRNQKPTILKRVWKRLRN